MAEGNFTDGQNLKATIEAYCSAEVARKVHAELIFLSVINIFLSIAAFLGNTLILAALNKESSLHPPSKLLYRNLAITDLCVGIISEPSKVAYWIFVLNERWDICRYVFLTEHFLGYSLGAMSLFTLTAISLDRYLALSLGLRYRQVITLKRTNITVMVLWIIAIAGASANFWNPLIFAWYRCIRTALCLVTTNLAYTKIFFSLRHNQIHVQNQFTQGQPSQAIPLNISRYKKTVYSALCVQVTLVVSYMPYIITVALTPQRGMSSSTYISSQFMVTLVYLNSSLNPLLYCWKIIQVRQAVKEILRQHFCLSS